jgi:hypothetical protein
LELAPGGEWWERLQRRAAWRGGQDGHGDDKRRLDLSRHLVNEIKCSCQSSLEMSPQLTH